MTRKMWARGLFAAMLGVVGQPSLAQDVDGLDFLLSEAPPAAPADDETAAPAEPASASAPEPQDQEPQSEMSADVVEQVAPYEDTIAVGEPDVPADTRPAPRASRLVEEVIVTAQKREESLQDVPISIQAFSADALDARGIEDPKALQLATPGLQYNVFAGYSLIYIRGVGTDAFIPSADASVATYIDNVYYPFGHSLASALGSVERVEVLKGPQGTLFGRNSTGGAINIVTKQPGPDPLSEVQVVLGNYGKTNVRAFVNVPLFENFAVSLSGLRYSDEQYYELHPDSPRTSLEDETSKAYSVKAGWTPGDLSVVLGYSYINSRGEQSMWLPAQDVKPLGRLLGVTAHDEYQFAQDAPTYVDTRARVLTADVKYATPWFDLRLIGGDQDIDSPALADYDGSQQPLTTFESLGQFAEVTTGEFQILSNAESWGSDWLTWIAGAYTIDSSAGYDPLMFSLAPDAIDFLVNPPPNGPLALLSGLTTPLLNFLGQVPITGGLLEFINNGVTLNLQGVLDTDSTAYFFQTTADLTDWMALTLGGRYQTETRKLVKSTTRAALNPNDPYQVVPIFNFGQREADTSNFSPKVVLDFKPFDGDLFYLSYTQGFKSGTYNIIAIYTPTQYIEPEKTTAYEIGYKGLLFDGAMQFNAAIFQNEIDNLQVQTISLTSGGAVRFETAGSARIRGAEFDFVWQVLPETLPGLVMTGAGSYLDGVYTDYKEGSGFDEQTGLFFDGTIFPSRDFTGNELVRTPEFSGNAGLSYTFDALRGNIEIAGDAYYNSGFYYSAQNTDTTLEDDYTVINARISYLYEPWNLRVTAYGKNLSDARYHYVVQELDFGTAKLLAPPATYGVRLNWEFF